MRQGKYIAGTFHIPYAHRGRSREPCSGKRISDTILQGGLCSLLYRQLVWEGRPALLLQCCA